MASQRSGASRDVRNSASIRPPMVANTIDTVAIHRVFLSAVRNMSRWSKIVPHLMS